MKHGLVSSLFYIWGSWDKLGPTCPESVNNRVIASGLDTGLPDPKEVGLMGIL